MEQNFVLRVNTKSWVGFRLVNISRFEPVAFRLKPTICGLFLFRLLVAIAAKRLVIKILQPQSGNWGSILGAYVKQAVQPPGPNL